jgi:hypothetical protein
VQKVVLIGSSNLKNSAPYFKDPAFAFLDNSLPGWMPTPENIATVQNTVRSHVAQQANAFVFDLLVTPPSVTNSSMDPPHFRSKARGDTI